MTTYWYTQCRHSYHFKAIPVTPTTVHYNIYMSHCRVFQYDPRFADPFWNSSKQSLSKHLLMILTSWALVVDVYYLPVESQEVGILHWGWW